MNRTIEEELPHKASNYFFKLSNILGIIPPCSAAFGPNQKKIKKLYRFYAAFLVLITILLTVITIIYRWQMVYDTFTSATLAITDAFLDATGTIANVATIVAPNFCHFSSYRQFLKHLEKTLSLQQQMTQTTKARRFLLHLAMGHAALLLLYVYEAYVWIAGWGWQAYSYYIFRHLQNYHIFITVLIINFFVASLKNQFYSINQNLRNETKRISRNEESSSVREKIDYDVISCSVQKLTRLYEKQTIQMRLFNKIFGLQLLFLVFSFSTSLIHSINLSIVAQNLNLQNELKFHLIVVNVFWSFWQLILGSLAVVSCSAAEQESQETASVCLNLLIHLPICTKDVYTTNLRYELNLLTQLATQKCPSFSAAGFFSINNALLLGICGSVTSYVIVLIQLK